MAEQDTTFTVNNVNGGKTTFPVPSGMGIDIHVPGLHYNRKRRGFVSWGQAFMKSRSTVLEGASQVHTRTVPRGLAEGRVYPIQPRYAFLTSAP
jgi:hypothetical protein